MRKNVYLKFRANFRLHRKTLQAFSLNEDQAKDNYYIMLLCAFKNTQ